MDLVGGAGLLLSATGVALSAFALRKAASAAKAVSEVLKRADDQFARDGARDLLMILNSAREAATARRHGAPRPSSIGRSAAADRKALEAAQHSLATTTITDETKTLEVLRAAAAELDQALQNISSNSDRDGWADAVPVLQGVIPDIERLQRALLVKSIK